MGPDVSIIIPNYNGGPLLKECISSIGKALGESAYEIIVVDNASSDESLKLLDTQNTKLRIVRNADNKGFAAAVNEGARQARLPILMILNSDTTIPPRTIETLVNYLSKNPECGIVAPRLVNSDGSQQLSVGPFPSIASLLGGLFLPKQERGYYKKPNDRPSRVDWASGACLMIRKELFDTLGGLDERYFFNYEDMDLCKRVRASNHTVVYFPQATILHHKGVSSRDPSVKEKVIFEKRRSQLLFYQKHHPGITFQFIKLANIAWALAQKTTGRIPDPLYRKIMTMIDEIRP